MYFERSFPSRMNIFRFLPFFSTTRRLGEIRWNVRTILFVSRSQCCRYHIVGTICNCLESPREVLCHHAWISNRCNSVEIYKEAANTKFSWYRETFLFLLVSSTGCLTMRRPRVRNHTVFARCAWNLGTLYALQYWHGGCLRSSNHFFTLWFHACMCVRGGTMHATEQHIFFFCFYVCLPL
jgi:hypothetical protein